MDCQTGTTVFVDLPCHIQYPDGTRGVTFDGSKRLGTLFLVNLSDDTWTLVSSCVHCNTAHKPPEVADERIRL